MIQRKFSINDWLTIATLIGVLFSVFGKPYEIMKKFDDLVNQVKQLEITTSTYAVENKNDHEAINSEIKKVEHAIIVHTGKPIE